MKQAARSSVARAPMFSVLVPSYNHAKYLGPALDSLTAQTVADWEAVVVDDGSTDASLAVAESAAARDPRIRVIRQANGGVASALNTAAAHARGRWLCWLSADDLFMPTALATFAAGIAAHPDVRFFHADFHLLDEPAGTRRMIANRAVDLPKRAEQVIRLFQYNYVSGITVCFQRSLFAEIGLFDGAYPSAQDLDYWLRVAARTELHYLDEVVAVTRVHEGQDTQRMPGAGLFDSARSHLAFLASHEFPALFPSLDLTTMPGLSVALDHTLRVALRPDADLYAGTGPTPYLLDRFRIWLHGAHPTPVCQAIAHGFRDLLAAELSGPLREALERFGAPDAEPLSIPDPFTLMVDEYRRLMDSGSVLLAARIGQYLLRLRPELAAAAGIRAPVAASDASAPAPEGSSAALEATMEIHALSPQRELQGIVDAAGTGDVQALRAAVSRAAERFPLAESFARLDAQADDHVALRSAALGLGSGHWHLSRIPRIAHFYWGGERTSYLRYLSVASFRQANPDWEVRVYVPATVSSADRAAAWVTRECYEGTQFFGRDYTRDLFALPDVQFVEVSFERWPGIAAARETFKADLFRWHILSTAGGLYSDADIVYHRPMSAANFNTPANRDAEVGYCQHHGHHFIGFLLAAPQAALFRRIAAAAPASFDERNYQSIGAHLLNVGYPTDAAMVEQHGAFGRFNVSMDVVYAYDWRVIDRMHAPGDLSSLPADAIGIHWYGGANSSQQYNALVTHENCGRFGSILDQLVAAVSRTLTPRPGVQLPPVRRRSHPRFSVLVPTYNQATLLPLALDSLMAQTFTDFEVLVVNDGSTDDTRSVLDAYAAAHPRVRAFHQPNGGVGVALNAALAQATGDWICWLSSDDLFEPTALATFVASQQAYPATRFFYANFSLLHDATGRVEPMPAFRQVSGLPMADVQTLSLLQANHINGITICIERALVQSAGGWNPAFRYAQDYDLWLRLSVLTRFQFIDERVAVTRIHAGQDTHRFPMGGFWDSSRAAHAFLNTRTFMDLCPWADLANDASVLRVVRAALLVIADPNAFIHQGVGPHAILIDRLAEWLTVPDPTGRNRALAGAVHDGIRQMQGLAPQLLAAADRLKRAPSTLVATSDPVALMRDRLRESPGATWAAEMDRYLTAIARNVAPTALEAARLAS